MKLQSKAEPPDIAPPSHSAELKVNVQLYAEPPRIAPPTPDAVLLVKLQFSAIQFPRLIEIAPP